MAERNRGMGKGLAAILSPTGAPAGEPPPDLRRVPVELISPNPRQPRQAFAEEGRACALLVDELGLTREDVGRRVGRSRVAVSNLMRLLDLPDEVLDLLVEGKLTEGHGRALLLCKDHAARRALALEARDGGWSVRETERRPRGAGVRVAGRRGRAGGADPGARPPARRLNERGPRGALGTRLLKRILRRLQSHVAGD